MRVKILFTLIIIFSRSLFSKDYYFHKWSQQKRHMQQVHGNQVNRQEHRAQYISYPVLQLLKSIQQEKEYDSSFDEQTIDDFF